MDDNLLAEMYEHYYQYLLSQVIGIIVIGFFSLVGLVLILIAVKKKWFRALSFGRNGVSLEAEAEEEIRFQSGNLNNLLDTEIHKLDTELVKYALETGNKVRRGLTIELSKRVNCSSTRRALASCLRYPLFEAAKRNFFKEKLRPENIKEYIDFLMKEVVHEYQEFAIERETAWCPVKEGVKCPDLPPLDELLETIRQKVVEDWALPIRKWNIEICKRKIEKYKNYIPSFEEFHDNVRIKISNHCIEKNQNHIAALSRKADKEAGEF